MTFRQAKELGAHVRKGEKGALVVYANTITRTEENQQTGEEEERAIPFMRVTPCSTSSRSRICRRTTPPRPARA
ncbi:ArdC family protein [Rhodobacteraceae bacterium KMM 6894]|nr:ArdC family protein [Rhodobacteraceae bacterium KMM 6894]